MSHSPHPAKGRSPEDAPGKTDAEAFDQLAQERQTGLLREFLQFAVENKKWWLIPIMLVLLLVAVFIFVSGTAGPFVYPLF